MFRVPSIKLIDLRLEGDRVFTSYGKAAVGVDRPIAVFVGNRRESVSMGIWLTRHGDGGLTGVCESASGETNEK